MEIIFTIIILIMSVVIHEVSHGYVAYMFGDLTAKHAGRLTLNPIPHLDPIGSFVVPIISSIGGFFVGWARPVPYNPYNLRNERWGTFLVAIAGVLANFLVAIVFGLLIRFGGGLGLPPSFFEIASLVVYINLFLGVLNLLPIPPLDGSKVLLTALPVYHVQKVRRIFEGGDIFLLPALLIILFLLLPFLVGIVSFLFTLITGFPPFVG